jgi:hypothetical protein
MKCLLCSKPIFKPARKYCSNLCNQRDWYLAHVKPQQSVFRNNPQMGIRWEEWFIERYGATRPQESLNTPFDFWWQGERIDLKVSELKKRKMSRGRPVKQTNWYWLFQRNSDSFDFALCLALIDNQITRVYKIPNSAFPRSAAFIGRTEKSKYDPYLFDLPMPSSLRTASNL